MDKGKRIVTDMDTNQSYVQLGVFEFLFKEDRVINPITKEIEVFEKKIDIRDYELFYLIDVCSTFGYSSVEVTSWVNSNENLELIAECIFELSV